MSLFIKKATQVFTVMDALLNQLKKRRLALGIKQSDMQLRIGISRQQYQRLESKGNPRLDTLALIATGLNSELMLIPKEKLKAVQAVLDDEGGGKLLESIAHKTLSEDPWQGLLGESE